MKTWVSAVVVTAIVLGATPAFAKDATIKIGVVQPLTGSVAYNGKTTVNGVKLAVEKRNKAGGVLGRKIQLDIEDGQCAPASSVSAAQKLIQKDKVMALIGAFCSSATAAVMPVAKQNKTPLISGVSSDETLTEKHNPWFFRSTGTDALLAKSFASAIRKDLNLKKIAYIGVNDDWGRGAVTAFRKAFSDHGVKSVMTEYFSHGTTDFYTLLTKLRNSGADGVFVAAETQDGSTLIKQLKQFGIDMKVFGTGSWATSSFIKLTGDAADGIYAAVPYVSTMPGEHNKQFVKAYEANYKNEPGKYAVAGYNAASIMMDAIQRAGSTDAQKIRAALKSTDYNGPNGRFRFTANGQAYGFNLVLVQIKHKSPEVIDTASVKAPKVDAQSTN